MNTRNDRATWLKGDSATCSIPPKLRLRPPRLAVLGAPGVGKGTQAELLSNGLHICHLSTGDIFRATDHVPDRERSPAMNDALACMHHGGLVADDTVVNLIRERMKCLHCRGGFLLDGFPRTVRQAEILDDLLAEADLRLDAVLNYTLPTGELVQRLSGRRTCQECKATFHLVSLPPRVPDVCDFCGGVLFQRDDDLPEVIAERLHAYEQSTKPLLDFYLHHGLLRTISADGTPKRIHERTLLVLDS